MTSATDFFTTMIFPMAFALVVAAEDRRLRLWRKLTFLYLGPLSFSWRPGKPRVRGFFSINEDFGSKKEQTEEQ
jgi:hypothetical protein